LPTDDRRWLVARITAIEPQKKRSNRRSIYVDGQFAAGVDEEVVVRLKLGVGQDVDPARLALVLRAEEIRRARESALTLLDYRARTTAELERRLTGKGYPEEVVAEVIADLTRAGLVDDERFAAQWVAGRLASRPSGRARLAWELRSKGLTRRVSLQPAPKPSQTQFPR
jgi:regulatory protein